MLFSEPKIPQCQRSEQRVVPVRRFSALQRAENSSISGLFAPLPDSLEFQCSSASRKFLNGSPTHPRLMTRKVSVLFSEPKIPQCALVDGSQDAPALGFSALQRAENSSIGDMMANPAFTPAPVSVLFSEPKIPQSRPSHLRPSIFPTATITLRRS